MVFFHTPPTLRLPKFGRVRAIPVLRFCDSTVDWTNGVPPAAARRFSALGGLSSFICVLLSQPAERCCAALPMFLAVWNGDRVDAFGGKVFVENKTNKPLTVEVPPAVVGVHVLNQIGGLQGGGALGGGLGGGGGGGGVYSIPPESVAMLKCATVCLNHGKPDPRPKINYRLVRVEQVTTDAVLTELLAMVGTGRLDRHSAQAAAWHLTDEMSWRDLATKNVRHIHFTRPYFTAQQIARARSILAHAQGRARKKAEQTSGEDTQPLPERVPSRAAITR